MILHESNTPWVSTVASPALQVHTPCHTPGAGPGIRIMGCTLTFSSILVGGFNPLKDISQLGSLFPIYGKIKNVPNNQPENDGNMIWQKWPEAEGKMIWNHVLMS